jgi:ArsR family transcriptional regulator, zinc-responsive transcriptional repressor
MSTFYTTALVPFAELSEAADCLRSIAHPVRLRIIDILLQGEYPVHQIAECCELAPHQTCEHLRLLKGQGHLAAERRGREVYYRLVNPRLPRLLACLRQHAVCRGINPTPEETRS